MAENKTKATTASVADYLANIADSERRSDCEALVTLMSKVTKQPAVMWGTGIVGFGSYHYKYDSGREGDMCAVGFAARKGDISVYVVTTLPEIQALLPKLGKYKVSKAACLYLRRLSDVDSKVLEKIVALSVKEIKRRHP
jgi:hypothetical protein